MSSVAGHKTFAAPVVLNEKRVFCLTMDVDVRIRSG